MQKTRLEAFSDAVIAIIMTIMVLELHPPEEASWMGLSTILPIFLSYVMSFVYLAIYWNNHHHMLHTADHVDGRVLWANMNLLFWLSLFPLCTSWMQESEFSSFSTALYGVVLLLAAVAFKILQITIILHHGETSVLQRAVGKDRKGMLSMLAYLLSIPLSFVNAWIAIALFVLVGFAWLVPDRRIEKALSHAHA